MVSLKSQRRIAAKILKIGENKVWFDEDRTEEIKEAITRSDIIRLINQLAIQARPEKGVSGYRRRKLKVQKRKGRQKGSGSRKGKATSRLPRKTAWMAKVRTQRKLLKELKEGKIIDTKIFTNLYRKSKGGFFRSKRHIMLYAKEHGLLKEKPKKETTKPAAKKPTPTKETKK